LRAHGVEIISVGRDPFEIDDVDGRQRHLDRCTFLRAVCCELHPEDLLRLAVVDKQRAAGPGHADDAGGFECASGDFPLRGGLPNEL
jgi:hypothetical protein